MARYIPAYADPIDPVLEKHISGTFSLPPLLARMLIRRGIVEDDRIASFLEPAAEPLLTPFAFPDMDKAVERIRNAILFDENIDRKSVV